MPQQWENLQDEQDSFDAEVKRVEQWWNSPRQKHITRPYSSKTIAALRGTKPLACPSNPAALKLWDILHKHRDAGTAELTFGVTDPIAQSQMAKFMRTVYLSGGLSGFSENNYPGMDHADYPWDTVPKVVDKLFKAQIWHDQRQRQHRLQHSPEKRAELENWDYLMPIIADGDMGFGSLTSTIKCTKAMVDSGAAGIHLDDLAIGMKKFTLGQGRTIVPTQEYVDRIKAVRMQLDIMGAETLIFARCDTDHADFITSVIDPRDHEYVLGATQSVRPLQDVLDEAAMKGESVKSARDQWMISAGLNTYDGAVEAFMTNAGKDEAIFAEYKSKVGYGTSLAQRRSLSKTLTGVDIPFDWDIPRSHSGQYMFRPTVNTIVERALAVVQFSDVSWTRMDSPNYWDIKSYHEAMLSHHPKRLFAFAWGGEWPFPASAGWTSERLKTISQDMARDFGVVWQVQPMYMIQGVNMEIERSSDLWTREGMGGYYEKIQVPATSRKPYKVDGYEKLSWCGGYLSDAFFAAVAGEEIVNR